MDYALTELKESHPWLRNYHSKMLQMVAKQVAAARNTARKLTYSYNFTAFTYNQTGFRIENDRQCGNKVPKSLAVRTDVQSVMQYLTGTITRLLTIFRIYYSYRWNAGMLRMRRIKSQKQEATIL